MMTDTQRGLMLLEWFRAFKHGVQEMDSTERRGGKLPVPDFLTSGDVYRQNAMRIIREAEAAMEESAPGGVRTPPGRS